ncbi:SigE family RNA polymerase sigma factor [Nocardioides pelophilus]|uniref:SigE family RNA polymerase sigma factor n=1 Tax=Nocardioides pelophilus TaxID=2172019 RepID=UPI001FE66D79|nr:SigE family RNA polymerase sigma factor [Nocardioides pelophilus]
MMDVDEAFTAYVAQRRLQLFRTACLLCGDPHQAEDVVQDALARLYAAWPRASRADNVDGYVRRAIVNSHLNQVRRPWHRERPAAAISESPAPVNLPTEDLQVMWAAIANLPLGQRKVVVLRHFLGLSVEETAADLGISAGTVKSQTSDGLAALRRALTAELGMTITEGEGA